MRPIRKPRTAEERRKRRHFRVRKTISGTPERPRLVVFRSLKHIYAQLVDDQRGAVLFGLADRSKVAKGFAVGLALAEKAKARGITRIVFDRAGYAYHGRVKAVADGARKGGLEF